MLLAASSASKPFLRNPNIMIKDHKIFDCIVVGAGPAGLMAAIRASELGKKTIILEKMHNPGLKLLISGKGRCNITNVKELGDFIDSFGKNGKFLYGAFTRFFTKDLLNFFEERGIEFNIERGGRVFPKSNTASTILNCLLDELKKLGVKLLLKTNVVDILVVNGKAEGVVTEKGDTFYAKSIIVTCGGMSYPLTGSTGDGYKLAKKLKHTIAPPKPSLIGLHTKEKEPKEWQGVNLKNVEISLYIDGKLKQSLFGEMVFTHFGISGPIILQVSKNALNGLEKGGKVIIKLDLKPALSVDQLDARLIRDFKEMGTKIFKNYAKELLPSKMIKDFVKLSEIDPDKKINQITQCERHGIIDLLKNMRFTICGSPNISEAIITSGGIETSEINPKTMESKLIKGLFFAGEVIDVDGITGGYNLQAAFSTGYVAGESS